jgi:superfamily I DNA/RNA helicase
MAAPDLESVDVEKDEIGELEIAEYIVFVLALGTYIRYIGERAGRNAEDDLIRHAVQLIKLADRQHVERIKSFLDENLPQPAHKVMMAKAFKFLPTVQGLGRRSKQIDITLRRGGAGAMRAVFRDNKALRDIRAAMEASGIEDADMALDKFAVIPMRNTRMRKWIDKASETAGSGQYQNAVMAGANEATPDVPTMLAAKVQAAAASPASEESREANMVHEVAIASVQVKATDAAARAMAISKEPDLPPKRSEVVGIVAAAVAAAMSDPELPANIPPSLQSLGDDKEQIAAALTDGRVLVAAGAGAGKSTTLVARIALLTKDRGVPGNRIMACSFNKKAADELAAKIKNKIGANNVQVGTMHALFYKFICGDERTGLKGFGTPEEMAMLKSPRLIAPPKKGAKTISPGTVSYTIRNMWEDCDPEAITRRYGFPAEWTKEPPKAKKAQLFINKWAGNGISVKEALESAKTKGEACAAIWYDMYFGVKGATPGWRPPCESDSLARFMKNHRAGGERLGDLDDMLQVFRNILVRNKDNAKEVAQNMFDHILVDECQDLNLIQHQIFEMLSEKVTDTNGKSIWMIGDDKQAIYQFRGARPELFTALNGKPGWKIRMIRTNYRCEAEIVDVANRLIANNRNNIPMEARANPKKPRKQASIVLSTPHDDVSAAIATIGRAAKDIAEGSGKAKDYAVLARTNAELNNFETACIINELPYVRRTGQGFLEAPESKAVLGYIDLAQGTSFEKMKDSLVAVLMKPDRGLFGLKKDQVAEAVDQAMDDYLRKVNSTRPLAQRAAMKDINPVSLLTKEGAPLLAKRLKEPYQAKLHPFAFEQGVKSLTKNLLELARTLDDVSSAIQAGTDSTKGLIDFILDQPCNVDLWSKAKGNYVQTSTLRKQISADVAVYSDDDEADEAEKAKESQLIDPETGLPVDENGNPIETDKPEEKTEDLAGLGAVQFLLALAVPNANDLEAHIDPSTPGGFVEKINRYNKLAATLRIDPEKWALEHEGEEKTPPAITLSTIHGVKGLEWKNVAVLMPKGKFPMERKLREDEPEPDPEELASTLEAERNLAYVALTRPIMNLEVICPMVIDGREAGISPFVDEAGLVLGENVPKDAPADLAAVPPVEEVKIAYGLDEETAAMVDHFDQDYDDEDGYDWRAE